MYTEALLAQGLTEFNSQIIFRVLRYKTIDLSDERAACRELDIAFGRGVVCASLRLVIVRLASVIAKTWRPEEWNQKSISSFLHIRVKMVYKRTALLGRDLLNELAKELQEELRELR